MKKSLLPILVIIAGVILFFIFRPETAVGPMPEESENVNEQDDSTLAFPGVLPANQIQNKKAVINTEKGIIEFELLADDAPKSVSNFVYLVDNAFYDGLTFHRVVPGFVIQGGDPDGVGTGGPGYSFEDEPVKGEYTRGSVAMANSGPDTNGSQFFICLEDQLNMPKKYNLLS